MMPFVFKSKITEWKAVTAHRESEEFIVQIDRENSPAGLGLVRIVGHPAFRTYPVNDTRQLHRSRE